MANAYASQLATLLFCTAKQLRPQTKGRLIQFDITEPHPRYSTGPIQTRVLRYLSEHPQPTTLGKLAVTVDTRCERVSSAPEDLIKMGRVIAHKIDDETIEYVLND